MDKPTGVNVGKAAKTWEPTAERYVAFLDIMGFKDRVWRKLHTDVVHDLDLLVPTVKKLKAKAEQSLKMAKMGTARYKVSMIVRPLMFSDSILLVSGDDTWESAYAMFDAIQRIMLQGMDNDIPIKGALACGEETADFTKSLHFGRPLIDAYELQDELQMYGVVLHHTAEKTLAETQLDGDITMLDAVKKRFVVDYKTPMKAGGSVEHCCLTWQVGLSESYAEGIVRRFYGSVSGKPRKYVDNTLDFLRSTSKKS